MTEERFPMDDAAEADWKSMAERLYRSFFGRCWFTERYMVNASLDGRSRGIWTIDGHRRSDGYRFYSIAVESKSDLGKCYKNHVENFFTGMYSDANGRYTPEIEWSSDEELYLKATIYAMATKEEK